MKWPDIFKALAPAMPIILASVPHGELVACLVPDILRGVQEAEAIPGASGPDKKAHVLNLVADGVAGAQAEGVSLDAGAVLAAADKSIDVVVGVANIVHGLHQAAAA